MAECFCFLGDEMEQLWNPEILMFRLPRCAEMWKNSIKHMKTLSCFHGYYIYPMMTARAVRKFFWHFHYVPDTLLNCFQNFSETFPFTSFTKKTLIHAP